jgi:hypothetical protein
VPIRSSDILSLLYSAVAHCARVGHYGVNQYTPHTLAAARSGEVLVAPLDDWLCAVLYAAGISTASLAPMALCSRRWHRPARTIQMREAGHVGIGYRQWQSTSTARPRCLVWRWEPRPCRSLSESWALQLAYSRIPGLG